MKTFARAQYDASQEYSLDTSRTPGADTSREYSRNVCAWCKEPIPTIKRRDSKFCSKRCRQAHHRFAKQIQHTAAAATPKRLGYGDPPYPGKAWLYEGHPDFAGEVDHVALVSRLENYDGWALSTSAEALPKILPLAVEASSLVRVAAWFRDSRTHKSSQPRNCWEPVIYKRARCLVSARGCSDTLIFTPRPRLTDPGRVIGAKPAAFANWLFKLLGATPGDSFDDLYPGSGGMSRAWDLFNVGEMS